MPNEEVPWLLLERHWAGTCTAEEAAALAAWVAGDPRRPLLMERLGALFGGTTPAPDQAEIERAWAALAARLGLPPRKPPPGDDDDS